ncbi:MAG: sigma-70 family RNA polymerase sigma factor [bacterium]
MIHSGDDMRLIERAKNGDQDAMDVLIRSNLGFISSIAQRYETPNTPLSDLMSEGVLGLMEAIQHFDPSRGVKLTTYAGWWIEHYISTAVRREPLIKIPIRARRIARIHQEMKEDRSLAPSAEEVADVAGVSPGLVKDILMAPSSSISLDAPLVEDENATLMDVLDELASEGGQERAVLSRYLEEKIRLLPPREREMLRMRYGLDGGGEHTYQEIAEYFQLSRQRVEQILRRALQRLRFELQADDKGISEGCSSQPSPSPNEKTPPMGGEHPQEQLLLDFMNPDDDPPQ